MAEIDRPKSGPRRTKFSFARLFWATFDGVEGNFYYLGGEVFQESAPFIDGSFMASLGGDRKVCIGPVPDQWRDRLLKIAREQVLAKVRSLRERKKELRRRLRGQRKRIKRLQSLPIAWRIDGLAGGYKIDGRSGVWRRCNRGEKSNIEVLMHQGHQNGRSPAAIKLKRASESDIDNMILNTGSREQTNPRWQRWGEVLDELAEPKHLHPALVSFGRS